jgi:hypothetical protein
LDHTTFAEDGTAPTCTGERPLCQCHGQPSRWHKDIRRGAGGNWRCAINRRAADARYDRSDKRREARRRYKASEKGRLAQERYRLSDKGRATERRRILAAATRRRAARIEAREKSGEAEWFLRLMRALDLDVGSDPVLARVSLRVTERTASSRAT